MVDYCSDCGKRIGRVDEYISVGESKVCVACHYNDAPADSGDAKEDFSEPDATTEHVEHDIDCHESENPEHENGDTSVGLFEQQEWGEGAEKLSQKESRQEVVRDCIVKRTWGLAAHLSDWYPNVDKFYEDNTQEPGIVGLSICCICGELLMILAPDEELSELGFIKEGLPYEDVSDIELPVSVDPLRFCKTCGMWAKEAADTGIADYLIAEQKSFSSKRDELLPTLERYISTKTDTFKSTLSGLRMTVFFTQSILTDSLHLLWRKIMNLKFTGYLAQAVEIGHSLDAEAAKDFSDDTIEFLEELMKDFDLLARLFEKHGVEVNYRELLFGLYEVNSSPSDNDHFRAVVNAIRKRAPNPDDPESVLETMYRLPARTMHPDDHWKNAMALMVLDAFGMEKPEDFDCMIRKIEDTLELEEFERSFTTSPGSSATSIEGYDNLDGYAFEEWLKLLFTRLGYQSAVTKKSGDQGADLVVKKSGVTCVVQAKKYKTPVPNSAVQEAVAAKAIYGADKAIVVATSSFTDSAWELAVANQVELWDKAKLDDKLAEVNDTTQGSGGKTHGISSVDIDTGLVKFKRNCMVCGTENEYTLTASGRDLKFVVRCNFCDQGVEVAADLTEFLTCRVCSRIFDDLETFRQHRLECG